MMLPLTLFVLVCTLGRPASSTSSVVPPPADEVAKSARFIVNQADYAAVATFSTRKDITGYPLANVISLSDGAVGSGTGVPYLFMTPLDYTPNDLEADNRATLLVTLAQGSYCKDEGYNAMDPRCARAMISGRINKLDPDGEEIKVARTAMFSRHPWLAHLPANHNFFFAKMDIEAVAVLNAPRGPRYVTPAEYYNPPSPVQP